MPCEIPEHAPHAPKRQRLFVALPLPAPALACLEAVRAEAPGLAWTPKEALHLTLRFIGNVPQEDVPAVRAALRTVRAGPFSLRVRGLGMFARSRGAILWAGLEACPELTDLKRQVDAALERGAGLAPEPGRFSPHITLSRLKTSAPGSLRGILSRHAAVAGERFVVASFTLYSSLLLPGGSVHTPEEVYPLGA